MILQQRSVRSVIKCLDLVYFVGNKLKVDTGQDRDIYILFCNATRVEADKYAVKHYIVNISLELNQPDGQTKRTILKNLILWSKVHALMLHQRQNEQTQHHRFRKRSSIFCYYNILFDKYVQWLTLNSISFQIIFFIFY